MLRSTLFNLYFFGISTILTVFGSVARIGAPHRALGVATAWARCIVWGLRVICGIRVSVTGLENLPQGAALIASNHQSAFDTFIWLTLVPRCCYVLKIDLLRIPLFSLLVRDAGMIAVDRSGGAASMRAMLRDAEAAVQDGKQIIIFPEGTRAEPGRPLPLQPGIAGLAARLRLPVVPVVTDSGEHWGRRAFHKTPGVIHIAIQPPLPASLSRAELMSRLETALHAAPVA